MPITLEKAVREATVALKKNRALAPRYVRHLLAQLIWYRSQAQLQAEALDVIESALAVGTEHVNAGWQPIEGEEVFAEALMVACGGNKGKYPPILRLIEGGAELEESEETDEGSFSGQGDIA